MSASLLQVVSGPAAASATGTENIDLALPTGLDVSGSVTDPNGDPIAEAAVSLCLVDSGCVGGVTDPTGHYTTLGVEAGTYTVEASAPGYLNVWLGPGDTSVTDFSQAVTVDISADTTLPTLHLAAGFSISGTLTDPDGQAVPDVEVQASGDGGSGVGLTDADGHFVMTGFNPGFYGVQVAPPVGSPFTGGSISSGGTIERELFDYWIQVTGDTTGIDATLVAGRSISGTITGLSGPADVNVSGTVFGRALEIAPDGTFVATGLWPDEPQTLFVTVRTAGGGEDGQFPYGVYDGTSNLNPDQNAMAEIDVSGGDVTGLTLAAPSLPSVTGTVLDEADDPVRGFATLCSDDLGCAGATFASDGSFEFINLPDSTYHMYVVAADRPDGYVTASGGVSNSFADAVDIVVSGSDEVVDVTVPVGLTISGTITGPDGEPVVGGSVGASSPSGQFVGSTQTDANGGYVLRGLTEGDYYIRVNGPEGGDYFSGYWSEAGYTADYAQAGLVHVPSEVAAISTNPLDGATGVPRTIAPSATYSGSLLNVTGSTVRLHELGSATPIKATLTYDAANHTVTLNPKVKLHGRATYVFEISGVTTSTGGAVPDVVVTFTTRR